MYTSVQKDLQKTLDDIQTAGLYKRERLLDSPQASHVLSTEKDLINFCSNNYIGLANNPAVIAAAKESLDVNGFGMASVRFHLRNTVATRHVGIKTFHPARY